jgi:peptidoglycan hydrolase CwlO-like protein
MKEQVSRPLEVGNQALAQEVQRLHGEVENLKQDLVAKERQLGELGHQLGEKDNRIEKLEEKLHKALERIERLEEELRRKKKLKGKPLLRESALGPKSGVKSKDLPLIVTLR